MFSWDLMVLSRSSDFFRIEVEGWPVEVVVGQNFGKVSGTFLLFLPFGMASFSYKEHL